MKKRIIFLVLAVCAIINLPAQQQFNVQNGTKTEFYDDLETAISKTAAGDTIYLPGGIIEVSSNITINKQLAMIGAGWDTDSIGGLNKTELRIKGATTANAGIIFRTGSDGSLLTGCELGSITLGLNTESNTIQNVTIWRNKTNGNVVLGAGTTNNIKNIFIKENYIVGAIDGQLASDCWINNNLIGCTYIGNNVSISIQNLNNSYIYNNVLYCSNYAFKSLKECFIENNFIVATYVNSYDNSVNNCSFNNNAFASSGISFPNGMNGTNTGTDNLINQETVKTFQVNDFTSPKNLVILDESPCKKAGTDGTDIGIYGGNTPYKAGAVPFNPHINKAFVSLRTDDGGSKLKVDITVSAQDR
ncbi:MAG: hypothetical protein FWD60_08915 [Candidatus Azobacteroides sp.]|nr:hypothetical protein [Candidatus Azobacteroides sp.]